MEVVGKHALCLFINDRVVYLNILSMFQFTGRMNDVGCSLEVLP